ncbi:hypothetical protein [Oceanimonas sp. GK1]|nr:hypothetical protein [Oceanimonas sp. GK1]
MSAGAAREQAETIAGEHGGYARDQGSYQQQHLAGIKKAPPGGAKPD